MADRSERSDTIINPPRGEIEEEATEVNRPSPLADEERTEVAAISPVAPLTPTLLEREDTIGDEIIDLDPADVVRADEPETCVICRVGPLAGGQCNACGAQYSEDPCAHCGEGPLIDGRCHACGVRSGHDHCPLCEGEVDTATLTCRSCATAFSEPRCPTCSGWAKADGCPICDDAYAPHRRTRCEHCGGLSVADGQCLRCGQIPQQSHDEPTRNVEIPKAPPVYSSGSSPPVILGERFQTSIRPARVIRIEPGSPLPPPPRRADSVLCQGCGASNRPSETVCARCRCPLD